MLSGIQLAKRRNTMKPQALSAISLFNIYKQIFIGMIIS